MMKFRNINAVSDDPVEKWGFEGILAALERGGLPEWHKLYVSLVNDKSDFIRPRLEEALDILERGDVRRQLAPVFRELLKTV
jgi:hypothetical protein